MVGVAGFIVVNIVVEVRAVVRLSGKGVVLMNVLLSLLAIGQFGIGPHASR
jgi:hypothetical protein